jgi:hypothetical protein
MPSTQSPPTSRIAFRDMSEANRGGAFTPIDGALANSGGVTGLLRDLRDGLEITVYGAGDNFLVNVSEWRLAHDFLDRKRQMKATKVPTEAA